MTDKIKRNDKFRGLDKSSQVIEKIDTLNDMIILYQKQIKTYLDKITTDEQLQLQIKNELKLN